jgi:hypothetical protein
MSGLCNTNTCFYDFTQVLSFYITFPYSQNWRCSSVSAMHRYTACPSQDIDASERQRSQTELQGSGDFTTRLSTSTGRPHSSPEVSSIRPSLNTGPASTTTVATRTLEGPQPLDSPVSQSDHPISSTMDKDLNWKRTWKIPGAIVGFYLLCTQI